MTKHRLRRLPILAAAALCLAAGVWGGLVRLQWALPLPFRDASWITFHGPLMVAGFLGTVIGLERAVAANSLLAYPGPLLSAAAGLVLAAAGPELAGRVLAALAAASLAIVTALLCSRQPALHGVLLSLGAASWLAGNVFWLAGLRIPQLVWWWAGFLVLTIAGERVELSRLQRPRPGARPLLHLALAPLLAGLPVTLLAAPAGERLVGVGLAALAGWLARHDVAWRAAARGELPRFVALALGAGYVWLGAGGVLAAVAPPSLHPIAYAPALHAVFLGFAFAMVFAHAPIIFPAILQVPVPFRRRFYSHLALLQLAVALRFVSDLVAWEPGKRWGGMLGAAAIALFILNTASARLPPARASDQRSGGEGAVGRE